MARFMVSMPDDMIKKLDRRVREERRTRSEFLREAVRHHLAVPPPRKAKESANRGRNGKPARKSWTKKSLERYLLEKGLARRGCPGLDSLLGPIQEPADMKRVLRITKRLTGLSDQIIEDREDRV